MPNENSSFIPKSGVKTVKRSSGTKQIYLLAYVSYIFFFSTVFAVIGVYVYGMMTERTLTAVKDEMVTERERFAVSEIENIKQLNQRLTTTERLVEESTAPSRLFPDIESIVSSNIRFSGLAYEQLPNQQFKLELSGEAKEFNDIVAQQQLMINSNLLANAEVVEYDYSVSGEEGSANSGDVVLTFIFEDTRDLSAIAYIPAEDMATSSENVIIDGSVTPAGSSTSSTTN